MVAVLQKITAVPSTAFDAKCVQTARINGSALNIDGFEGGRMAASDVTDPAATAASGSSFCADASRAGTRAITTS